MRNFVVLTLAAAPVRTDQPTMDSRPGWFCVSLFAPSNEAAKTSAADTSDNAILWTEGKMIDPTLPPPTLQSALWSVPIVSNRGRRRPMHGPLQ
jgi:hypothetical protein